MHLDNQRLKAIQTSKKEIRRQIANCYDKEKLIKLDTMYNTLCEDEKQILEQIGGIL